MHSQLPAHLCIFAEGVHQAANILILEHAILLTEEAEGDIRHADCSAGFQGAGTFALPGIHVQIQAATGPEACSSGVWRHTIKARGAKCSTGVPHSAACSTVLFSKSSCSRAGTC